MKPGMGLTPTQQMTMQKRQRLNTAAITEYEAGALPNHNHAAATQTITVVTDVDFTTESVTTQQITFVTAVQGVD